MPHFVGVHRAPGISEEEFQMTARGVVESKYARYVQNYVNLAEGFIVTVYEADSEDALVREYERLGFPYEEIHEVQFMVSADQMRSMVGASRA